MLKAIALVIVLLSSAASAAPQSIVLKRGLPTDIWLTWPEANRFDEPGLIAVFPEYRQVFKGGELKLVKDAGFDFVRLTVDPAIFLWKPSPAKTDKLVAGVLAAIAEIRGAGLKVVVDLHSIPHTAPTPGTEMYLKTDADFAAYLELVAKIGTAITTLPSADVAFEPINEPTIDCDWDQPKKTKQRWPGMLKKLHAAARAAAPTLTLVLSGACWGSADGLSQINPRTIADDNIVWSFHSYEPFIFSHQGASWTDEQMRFVEGLAFPPQPGQKNKVLRLALAKLAASNLSKSAKRKMRKHLTSDLGNYFRKGYAERQARAPFVTVSAWAKRYGIPANRIMLGEFGVIRGDLAKPMTDAERVALLRLMRVEAERRGFIWSAWSWSGSFGISKSDETREFSPLLLDALGLPGH